MPALQPEHIFLNHLLQKQHASPLPKTSLFEIWPSVFLLICLAILVIIKLGAFPRLLQVIQASYNFKILSVSEREESNQYKAFMFGLSLFFVLNLAFLIYKVNLSFGLVFKNYGHFTQFLLFLLICAGVSGLRRAADMAIAQITGARKAMEEYHSSGIMQNQAAGLYMFPWIVLSQLSSYNPIIFISGALIIFGVSTAMRWLRGIIGSLVQERVGMLQIFSYFCGLEILPTLVLVKYIVETF